MGGGASDRWGEGKGGYFHLTEERGCGWGGMAACRPYPKVCGLYYGWSGDDFWNTRTKDFKRDSSGHLHQDDTIGDSNPVDCYNSRAAMIYASYKDYFGKYPHQRPLTLKNGSTMIEAVAYFKERPSEWRLRNDINASVSTIMMQTLYGDNPLTQKNKVALTSLTAVMTPLIGNTSSFPILNASDITIEAKNINSQNGLEMISQVANDFSTYMVDSARTFMKETRGKNGPLKPKWREQAVDVTALPRAMSSHTSMFQKNLTDQWAGLYQDLIDNIVDLDTRLGVLQGKLTANVGSQEVIEKNGVVDLKSIEKHFQGLSQSQMVDVLPFIQSLAAALEGRPRKYDVDLLEQAGRLGFIKRAESVVNGNISNALESLTVGSSQKSRIFNSSVADRLERFGNATSGYYSTALTKTDTSGFVPGLEFALEQVLKKFAADNKTMAHSLSLASVAVIGQDKEMERVQDNSNSVLDYVSSRGGSEKLQLEATTLRSEIDNTQEKVLKSMHSQSGSGLFPGIMGMVSDIFKQRDSVLSTASAAQEEMKAFLGQIAAGVGLNVTEFESLLLTAMGALRNVDRSGSERIAGSSDTLLSSAKAYSTDLTMGIQSQAVATTMSAHNSNRDIGSIASDLLQATNEAAVSASQQAGSSLDGLAGSSNNLASAGAALLAKVTKNSTSQATATSDLAELLSSAREVGSKSASQVGLVGSVGNQRISMSSSTIASALGAVLRSLTGFIAKQAQPLVDHLEKTGNNAGNQILAFVKLFRGHLKTLSDKVEAIGKKREAINRQFDNRKEGPAATAVYEVIRDALARERSVQEESARGSAKSVDERETTAPSTLGIMQATQSQVLSQARAELFRRLNIDEAELIDSRDRLINGVSSSLGASRDDSSQRATEISSSNVTLLKQADGLRVDKDSFSAGQARFIDDRQSLAIDQSADALRIGQAYSSINSSIAEDARLAFALYRDSISKLQETTKRKIVESASEAIALSPSMTIGDLADFLETLAAPVTGSVDPRSDDHLIAQIVSDLVTELSSGGFQLDKFLEARLADQADSANAQVLFPFFSLLNAMVEFGRQATENISSSDLDARAVNAESAGLLDGSWQAARNSQAQAANLLAGSEAQIEAKLRIADAETVANARLTGIVSKAASDAVGLFRQNLDSTVIANQRDLELTNLNYSLLESSWRAEASSATGDILGAQSSVSAEIGTTVNDTPADVLTTNMMSHIADQWSNFQKGDLVTMAKIPIEANAKILGLQAAVQASAARASRRISDGLHRVFPLVGQLDQMRIRDKSFAEYPASTDQSFSEAREVLASLQGVGIKELQTDLDSLIDQRRADAKDNILNIFISLNALVSKMRQNAIRIAEFEKRPKQ